MRRWLLVAIALAAVALAGCGPPEDGGGGGGGSEPTRAAPADGSEY